MLGGIDPHLLHVSDEVALCDRFVVARDKIFCFGVGRSRRLVGIAGCMGWGAIRNIYCIKYTHVCTYVFLASDKL